MASTPSQNSTARSQRFSSKNLTISSLRTEKERYVIPSYQRPYAWTSAQVSQLMQDLLDFHRNAEGHSTYSLGTIVCDEETPGIFSILDGQQRLTTIDLLLGEISRRLDRHGAEKHKRIISAYRYLGDMETSEVSPLPACLEQRNSIAGAITEFIDRWNLRDDQDTVNFLEKFEARILNQINVRRVVIPLSDKVANEAPTMFEIINMRGQKLSALDILKSRLLSRFSSHDRFGRALFTYLWRSTEELLPSPDKASSGYDLKAWQPDPSNIEESCEHSVEAPTVEELTIDEIINEPSKTSAERDIDGTNTSDHDDKPEMDSDGNDTQDELFEPPIDVMNMLVIANELLKYDKRQTVEVNSSVLDCQALATTEFGKRFDHIIQAEEAGTADVWRLMGALSVVLQTVGTWGRYRKASSDEFEGPSNAFNQLIQTFMASNSFSASAQYWLLLLSATALENSLGQEGKLPTDFMSFLTMKKPAFERIRNLAELRLLTWAYHVAEVGQAHPTEEVFELIKATPSEREVLSKLKEAQFSVETSAAEWRYSDGSLSQFDLYLTDYVLWVDGHASENGNFASLKQVMKFFGDGAQSKEQTEIAQAIRNFDWATFETKAQTLRIVARSDIEHWLARNRASIGRDEKSTDEELFFRHGYGNLALINQNDNSSLGNGAPAGKAEIVLKRMSNPTPKLLWLAVISLSFTKLSGRHVADLSKLWASYIGSFHFGCENG